MHHDSTGNDPSEEEFPDAYLSVSLTAAPEGISLVENEQLRGTVVAWNGRHAGTVRPGTRIGEYRYSPNTTGRFMGAPVTVRQLIVLVPRFAASQRGQMLTDPARSRFPLEVIEAALSALPIRAIDKPLENQVPDNETPWHITLKRVIC